MAAATTGLTIIQSFPLVFGLNSFVDRVALYYGCVSRHVSYAIDGHRTAFGVGDRTWSSRTFGISSDLLCWFTLDDHAHFVKYPSFCNDVPEHAFASHSVFGFVDCGSAAYL